MKIIIPMAGMGKRMRPHTLTIPKPLIKIAGKTIVHRLIEELSKSTNEQLEEIAYIIGDFGKEAESNLIQIAESIGAKGKIYYQHDPLGTAHAILCAKDSLEGNIVVAFADTLFRAEFVLNKTEESIIWVQKIDDPSSFGVVKQGIDGYITDFYEKPDSFVSDLAIIGIYYFKDGDNLKKELQYLIDNNIVKGNEYQLTDALQNMKSKGLRFAVGEVSEWLDCGNKDATVYTHKRVLEHLKHNKEQIFSKATLENSIIIPPCFIDDEAIIKNSIIGPHVSIGKKTCLENTIISNSIVQDNSLIINANIANSMIGSNVEYIDKIEDVSIGDYSVIKI